MEQNALAGLFSCMTSDDDFLKRAEEAQKQAKLTPSELERDRWLRIAQGWLSLVRKRPRGNDQEEK
jgi:hypothetical protein